MEKLKAKHDHKLTDILKVMIFALFLILPGLIILPSMLYYGVNEHATAPTDEVEVYEYKQINFNQKKNLTTGYRYNTSTTESAVIWDNVYLNTGNRIIEYNSLQVGHVYYVKDLFVSYSAFDDEENEIPVGAVPRVNINNSWITLNTPVGYTNRFTASNDSIYVTFASTFRENYFNMVSQLQIFDLTQMFGEGNEPTEQEFNTWFTNNYYPYNAGENMTLEIDTGNTETYTDITSQIQYNWTSLWQQPLFSWTNYTIVKQGIDNFTGVFGITNTSNISNLIAYELIIVAIYIVIDIVLTLFKWLTHLIGEK